MTSSPSRASDQVEDSGGPRLIRLGELGLRVEIREEDEDDDDDDDYELYEDFEEDNDDEDNEEEEEEEGDEEDDDDENQGDGNYYTDESYISDEERVQIATTTGLNQPATAAIAIAQAQAREALLNRLSRGNLLSFFTGTDSGFGQQSHRARPREHWRPKALETPQKEGVQVAQSGDFGTSFVRREREVKHASGEGIYSTRRFPYSVRAKLLAREYAFSPRRKIDFARTFLPNTLGRLAVKYDARAYSGQFSQDGSFFYTCAQDFRVRLYDTTDPSKWSQYKTLSADHGRWTITDANLSPDNKFVAYSSITPIVYMASTDPDGDERQEILDFRGPHAMGSNNGIWSLRFSGNAKEIVIGASDAKMYVYDIESKKVVLNVRGHVDDVNAVCFADPSSHVLFSGSDDSFIKVWDRRSMGSSNSAAGVFIGHMEGITYISPKGDGRYVCSNAKDQTMKLWDIRKLLSQEQSDKSMQVDYSTGYDYRHQRYPGPVQGTRPDDCSVMTYTGHSVLKTLIRCGFSPSATTDQQYLFTGSDCGRVFVYNLDGTVKATLGLGPSTGSSDASNSPEQEADRSTWSTRRLFMGSGRGEGACIRDVAWHPTLPVIASTSWHDAMDSGSVHLHEWAPEGETIPDTGPIVRVRSSAQELRRRRG